MTELSASRESRAPVAEFSRRYRFSASHRLHIGSRTDEENHTLFGKCNNPYGHGHNYTLQISLRGPVDAVTGMVADLAGLDAFVREHVLERFDFANLNHDAAFADRVPSTENLALELWDLLAPFAAERGPGFLRRVRVEETSNNAFDYFGPQGAVRDAASAPERRPFAA